MQDVFPKQPDIRPTKKGYILETEYIFRYSTLERIRVPAGYVTDGASVPRLAWAYMPPDGLHRAASVIHDWLYDQRGVTWFKKFTRQETDLLFHKILRLSGVGKIRAYIAFAAVRAGGWTYWNT